MSNKLKPCPFCGGEAHYLEDSTIFKLKEDGTAEKLNRLMYFVWCTKCTALVSGNTNAEAIEAWNRRVTDVQRNDQTEADAR